MGGEFDARGWSLFMYVVAMCLFLAAFSTPYNLKGYPVYYGPDHGLWKNDDAGGYVASSRGLMCAALVLLAIALVCYIFLCRMDKILGINLFCIGGCFTQILGGLLALCAGSVYASNSPHLQGDGMWMSITAGLIFIINGIVVICFPMFEDDIHVKVSYNEDAMIEQAKRKAERTRSLSSSQAPTTPVSETSPPPVEMQVIEEKQQPVKSAPAHSAPPTEVAPTKESGDSPIVKSRAPERHAAPVYWPTQRISPDKEQPTLANIASSAPPPCRKPSPPPAQEPEQPKLPKEPEGPPPEPSSESPVVKARAPDRHAAPVIDWPVQRISPAGESPVDTPDATPASAQPDEPVPSPVQDPQQYAPPPAAEEPKQPESPPPPTEEAVCPAPLTVIVPHLPHELQTPQDQPPPLPDTAPPAYEEPEKVQEPEPAEEPEPEPVKEPEPEPVKEPIPETPISPPIEPILAIGPPEPHLAICAPEPHVAICPPKDPVPVPQVIPLPPPEHHEPAPAAEQQSEDQPPPPGPEEEHQRPEEHQQAPEQAQAPVVEAAPEQPAQTHEEPAQTHEEPAQTHEEPAQAHEEPSQAHEKPQEPAQQKEDHSEGQQQEQPTAPPGDHEKPPSQEAPTQPLQ